MTPKPPETLACVPEGRACSDGPLFVRAGDFHVKMDPLYSKVGYCAAGRETSLHRPKLL